MRQLRCRTSATTPFYLTRRSVLEDRQVEPAEARGVGDHLDLDDLAAHEREAEDDAAPMAPFTSAGRAKRARPKKVSATAGAPRTSPCAPACTAAPSALSTTSGSSTARNAPKSPPREAARKASTTSRWWAGSASGTSVAPRTRRRARLASILVAFGEHPRWGRSPLRARRTCRAARTRAALRG